MVLYFKYLFKQNILKKSIYTLYEIKCGVILKKLGQYYHRNE